MAAFVGVDIGTTSTKVIAYDREGRVLDEESAGYALRSPRPEFAEQDPQEILDAVVGSLAKVARALGNEPGSRISSVSFSAAMHSLLALDAEGTPLTASITYADNRASEQAARIKSELDGAEIHRRTGTPVHPMSPLAKLLWFREENRRVFENAARWVSIKEYVFYRLFGEYVVDYSIASATGLFNLRKLDWDEGALDLLGLPREKLSRPVPTTHVMRGLEDGYAERLGLDADTPFIVGANDGVLANLGVGATVPGVVACSIGTSGAVRSVVNEPRVDDGRKLFCYALTEDRWVIGGPINNGGIALKWAVEDLFSGIKEKAGEQGRDALGLASELAGEIPAGAGGLIFLPYLTGERAPHWNADVKGVFFGLNLRHGREHLIRAVMEGVIYQMHAVLQVMEEVAGEPDEVRATGGFANSEVWRQIMADVFRREIAFPESYESSCWGAVLLGMKALGEIDSLDVADEMIRVPTRHKPETDSSIVYERLAEIFGRLYDRLKPEFTEISEFQRRFRGEETGS